MAIDRTRQWWRGSEPSDLDEYLHTFNAGGYQVERVVHAVCGCGGSVFDVVVDGVQGYAERSCRSCRERFVMLDSADFADEADTGDAACPCGGEAFNVAVGFAFRDGGDVRWVSVGLRCVEDGVLGVYADWKIDYAPTGHLHTQV